MFKKCAKILLVPLSIMASSGQSIAEQAGKSNNAVTMESCAKLVKPSVSIQIIKDCAKRAIAKPRGDELDNDGSVRAYFRRLDREAKYAAGTANLTEAETELFRQAVPEVAERILGDDLNRRRSTLDKFFTLCGKHLYEDSCAP